MVEDYAYTTYVSATPEQVWAALTSADATAEFWGHRNESTWTAGDEWAHVRPFDGIADVVGVVVAADEPRTLSITFDDPATFPSGAPSTVTFTLTGGDGITRVDVDHVGLPTPADRDAVAHGWPAVCANLKTYLETGHAMPQAPWTMPPV